MVFLAVEAEVYFKNAEGYPQIDVKYQAMLKRLNPKLERGEDEFIEVLSLPLKDLHRECRNLEKDEFAIGARIGTIAGSRQE